MICDWRMKIRLVSPSLNWLTIVEIATIWSCCRPNTCPKLWELSSRLWDCYPYITNILVSWSVRRECGFFLFPSIRVYAVHMSICWSEPMLIGEWQNWKCYSILRYQIWFYRKGPATLQSPGQLPRMNHIYFTMNLIHHSSNALDMSPKTYRK